MATDDTETVAISDMTYSMVMDTAPVVKEGMMLKRPSRQGSIALGMTKQRFIVLQTDRLMWFKKGEMNDCILGEIPITPQTEIIRYPATMVSSEKMTVKTGSKELDLMPIKLDDITSWADAINEQIELLKTPGLGDTATSALGGLCRIFSGACFMAGKSMGCEPKGERAVASSA